MEVISERSYREKVYGGWMGKNIGGTLGGPLEGPKKTHDISYYPELPEHGGPLPNDDLDIQLVWLHALEEYGPGISADQLSQEWVEHIFFPMDEYGYAGANMRNGLRPPVSGAFNNPFRDCMGSPIRSEIWAMIAPGAPDIAACYAYKDAILDHAGGEGVYGEMFFAAMQSAAFFESSPEKLLDIGLEYIPEDSEVSRAIQDVRSWVPDADSWLSVREDILEKYGSDDVTYAPMNIAFAILGFLDGDDFDDALTKCVNCGYDTDSSGASLGALLGILSGAEQIPEKWTDPLGEEIVVSPEIVGLSPPDNLTDFTSRTLAVAKQTLLHFEMPIEISQYADPTSMDVRQLMGKRTEIQNVEPLWNESTTATTHAIPAGSERGTGLQLEIDYGEFGPAITHGSPRTIHLTLQNNADTKWQGEVNLNVPEGWDHSGSEKFELGTNEKLEWEPTIEPASTLDRSVYDVAVEVERSYYDSRWTTESIQFQLVTASRWEIEAPDGTSTTTCYPGNRLSLGDVCDAPSSGRYEIRSTISTPEDEDVRLVVGSSGPTRAWVDGEKIVDSDEKSFMRPAFHPLEELFPAIESKNANFHLDAGSHDFEMEIDLTDHDDPVVWVVPVASPEKPPAAEQPQPYSKLLDIMFL